MKKVVLKNFANFRGKHMCENLFFNKVAGSRLWNRCFPLNFTKYLKAVFLQNTFGRLLLISSDFYYLTRWKPSAHWLTNLGGSRVDFHDRYRILKFTLLNDWGMPRGFITNYVPAWLLWPLKYWSVKINEIYLVFCLYI